MRFLAFTTVLLCFAAGCTSVPDVKTTEQMVEEKKIVVARCAELGYPQNHKDHQTCYVQEYQRFMQNEAVAKYKKDLPKNVATYSALMGVAAFFSDERGKTDIVRIGTLDSGLGVYRFRYIGDDKVRIGVMAQEVQKKFPEAVVEEDGWLFVNYGKVR